MQTVAKKLLSAGAIAFGALDLSSPAMAVRVGVDVVVPVPVPVYSPPVIVAPPPPVYAPARPSPTERRAAPWLLGVAVVFDQLEAFGVRPHA